MNIKEREIPEILLTACSQLDPIQSNGFEDIAAGVDSIKASEMFAVGAGTGLHKADYQVAATGQLQWRTIKTELKNGSKHRLQKQACKSRQICKLF